MSAAPETFQGLPDEQKQTAGRLSLGLRLTALLFLALAALRIVGGVLAAIRLSVDALVLLPEGALYGLIGMVLFTGADDAGFLNRTKGADKEHLGNTLTSLKVAVYAQLGLVFLVSFLLMIRLAW